MTTRGGGFVTEFAGEFETHVTVQADDPARLDALRAWAEAGGLTFHHIILDRGLTPSQPMVTRRGRGDLAGELAHAAALAARLSADGFPVCRVKVEAAPDAAGVPAADADAARHPARYFEHHVKLLLAPDAAPGPLAAVAAGHAARVSRNARRVRADGRAERFVTQRCYDAGRATARGRLDALVAALAAGGYAVLSVEQEYVVHDTAPGVDAGWLDFGGAT
jgi:hypothetical protein